MSYMSKTLRDMAENLDRDLGPSEGDRQILRRAADLLESKNVSQILPYMVRNDEDALRAGLHELDTKETGKLLAVVLGVFIERGIDLRSFLPQLTETLLSDPDIAANLKDLGSLE